MLFHLSDRVRLQDPINTQNSRQWGQRSHKLTRKLRLSQWLQAPTLDPGPRYETLGNATQAVLGIKLKVSKIEVSNLRLLATVLRYTLSTCAPASHAVAPETGSMHRNTNQ